MENKLNQDILQEINITLEDQICPDQQFNNQVYNKPLAKTYEVAILCLLIMVNLILFFTIPHMVGFYDKEFDIHKWILFSEIITEYGYGILVPAYIIIMKKHIRTYLWTHIKEYYNFR